MNIESIEFIRDRLGNIGKRYVTNKELAKELGISVPTLRKIRRGKDVSDRIQSKVELYGKE